MNKLSKNQELLLNALNQGWKIISTESGGRTIYAIRGRTPINALLKKPEVFVSVNANTANSMIKQGYIENGCLTPKGVSVVSKESVKEGQ